MADSPYATVAAVLEADATSLQEAFFYHTSRHRCRDGECEARVALKDTIATVQAMLARETASPSSAPHQAASGDIDRVIQVLALEYQSLNGQLLARLSARYQFLGFLTASAAILATGIGHPIFDLETWVQGSLAIAVFLFGVLCFWMISRNIAVIGARIATLEERINELVPTGPNASKLLNWESEHTHRVSFRAFFSSHGYRSLESS
jgi:hypothetical protein